MRILSCGAACQLRVNHCQAQCRTDIKRRAAVRPSVRLSVCPLPIAQKDALYSYAYDHYRTQIGNPLPYGSRTH